MKDLPRWIEKALLLVDGMLQKIGKQILEVNKLKRDHTYSTLSLSGTLKGRNKTVLLSGRSTNANLLTSRIFIN